MLEKNMPPLFPQTQRIPNGNPDVHLMTHDIIIERCLCGKQEEEPVNFENKIIQKRI